jgi:signal transduction histidine kinase
MQPTSATQLVKDAAEAFQPAFSAKGVALSTVIGPGATLTQCDHERIMQVLANLLSNALKFTERGGLVTLSVAENDGLVSFAVTDTGVGIPAGHVLTIFERFQQAAPKHHLGLGLGLYIAKCIIEAHGGTIWAASPEAGGAALSFTLWASGNPLH